MYVCCLGFSRFALPGLVDVVPCFALLLLRPLFSLLPCLCIALLWSYRVHYLVLDRLVGSCCCCVFAFVSSLVVNTDRQTITTLYLFSRSKCLVLFFVLLCVVLLCVVLSCVVLSCLVV